MTQDRWTLAREAGLLPSMDGPVLAMLARGDADLSNLVAGAEVMAVQGFRPDYDRLAARGLDVQTQPEGLYGGALVQIVKSKPRTLSAIAEALSHLRPGGVLLVDGAKDEGIDSAAKALKKALGAVESFAKSHGKLLWVERPNEIPDALLDWIATPQEVEGGYLTAPGGFSA
ncbi:MAG: hypothetical protein AAF511_12275, partial [Pseudomonadota bacterium]